MVPKMNLASGFEPCLMQNLPTPLLMKASKTGGLRTMG